MSVQDLLITDRQTTINLFSHQKGYRICLKGKDYLFSTLDKVHQVFLKQEKFDTIRLNRDGVKSYLHLFDGRLEVFTTKKALRRTLSQEGGGAWVEKRNGKKRYFIDESEWLSPSYKKVTKQECLQRLEAPPSMTMAKALGIGLGALALLPGALEIIRHLPVGSKEAAMGLIALNQRSPLLGALGCSLLPSTAGAQAVGTEFQVNTYTTSLQHRSSVAGLNDGGFVVTWTSDGQDGNFDGIYGQRYDSGGVQNGSEFQVNTYTSSNQDYPSVAPLNDGGFVVTWQSNDQDGDLYGIYGQRYDSSGAPVGTEFQSHPHLGHCRTT